MDENLHKNLEFEEDTQKDKFLTFTTDKEDYGIEIKYVTEIIGIQDITEVPELPDYVKGIINLRGKIIPVMDIRLRFKKQPREYNDRTCIIVTDIKDITIGFIVDSVSEVISIEEKDIVPPPTLHNNINNRYIKGIGKIGKNIKLLLDCEKILKDDEISDINGML